MRGLSNGVTEGTYVRHPRPSQALLRSGQRMHPNYSQLANPWNGGDTSADRRTLFAIGRIGKNERIEPLQQSPTDRAAGNSSDWRLSRIRSFVSPMLSYPLSTHSKCFETCIERFSHKAKRTC